VLLPAFVLAGLGIGCAETAESAAVASLAPGHLRGSAFGLLATVQSAGNLIASSVAGLLWSEISPTVAFIFLAAAILIAAALIMTTVRTSSSAQPTAMPGRTANSRYLEPTRRARPRPGLSIALAG
jgi:MFS family permease